MFKTQKKIPQIHLNEFLDQHVSLIKNRVQFSAWIFILGFVGGTLVGNLFVSRIIPYQLIITWILIAIVCVTVSFLVKTAKTIRSAKFYALLLIALLLGVIVRYHIKESSPPFQALTLYLIMLFTMIFIIPWLPFEIIYVALLHFGAYTLYFFNMNVFIYKDIIMYREFSDYMQGVIMLFITSCVYFVVTGRERNREIENFILMKELEKEKQEVEWRHEQMQRELAIATRVHKTLIPKSVTTDLVDIAVTYLPMYYMGGDYAKFYFIDKNKLSFIICDVTGHGVSASLLVNRLHAEFERLAREGKEPGILLNSLNEFIQKDFEGTNMYLSAFSGMLDFEKRKLFYSNHGHPAQFVYKFGDSNVGALSSQASLLGLPIVEDNVYQGEMEIHNGDRIFLFTDGVTETKNEDREEYGHQRLELFIKKNCDISIEKFNERLMNELNAYKAGRFTDDIFLLSIHIKVLTLSQKIKGFFQRESEK